MNGGPRWQDFVPFGDALSAAGNYLTRSKSTAQKRVGKELGSVLSNGFRDSVKAASKPRKPKSPLSAYVAAPKNNALRQKPGG